MVVVGAEPLTARKTVLKWFKKEQKERDECSLSTRWNSRTR